ncbi:MAG: FAD-dependent oxidoreductase [Planctomycetaceae bacterium]
MSHLPVRGSAADDAGAPATDAVELLEELPALRRKNRKQRLVLVGAGQIHLRLLDWWRERPIRGVELTLLTAESEAVIGSRLPLALAGSVPDSQVRIDLSRAVNRSGATLLVDKVIGLDAETRTLQLALHDDLPFDVASFNLGSANRRDDLCRQHRLFVPIRPRASFLSRFFHRWRELESQWQLSAETERLNLVIVGGGPTGVELALALNERVWRERWPAQVELLEARPELLGGWSPRTARLITRLFQQRRIRWRGNALVTDCDDVGPARLMLENGEQVPADLVIWAAGGAPPAVIKNLPLPTTPRGWLAVRRTLQTTSDLPVFAVGRTTETAGGARIRAPAEAQAAVLWENLRQTFRGGKLSEFQPRPSAIRYLTCGDGSAVAEYHGWALRHPWLERRRLACDGDWLNRLRK